MGIQCRSRGRLFPDIWRYGATLELLMITRSVFDISECHFRRHEIDVIVTFDYTRTA